MPKVVLAVGEPCPTCNIPAIAGRDGGGYCKPCYIKWKNGQPTQPAPAPQPVQDSDFTRNLRENKENEKWDKISWGKCKYGFLVELLKKDISLEVAETQAEQWADASMRKL